MSLWSRLRQQSTLARHPKRVLSELRARSMAKVSVRVTEDATPLRAPITGRPCAFYSVSLREWDNGGLYPLLSEHSTARLSVEDDSGSGWIRPSHLDADLRTGLAQGHSSEYWSAHRELLARHGLSVVDSGGELRSMSWRESILVPGDTIWACGIVDMETSLDGVATTYRQPPRTNVLTGSSRVPLLIASRTRVEPLARRYT